jgi:3-deoxy-D-manno-octulosonic-acid transferase
VVTGPSHANGEDVASLLFEAGAALQVADAAGLAAAVVALLRNPRERQRMGTIGRNTVEANRGSVLRLLDLMAPLSASAPRPGHP